MNRPLLKMASVLMLAICVSCQQSGPTINSELAAEFVNPLNIQKGGEFSSLGEIRAQAKALIDSRISNSAQPLSFLTHGYWVPEFVYNDRTMSKIDEYLGHWIDFQDSYDYTYGYFDDVLGTGRYHYRLDDNTLIMLDSNPEIEPKVWKAPYNGDIMAFVGTHEFGINNGMQIKMIPQDNLPVKKEPS